MNANFPRIASTVAAVTAAMVLATAAPAPAQPVPTKGVTDILGIVLAGLRGAATAPAAPTPTPTAATPAPAGPPTAMAVERHLAGLHYDVGPVDGIVDDSTASAVMAFQKVNGLARTGVLTDQMATAILAHTGDPAPLRPGGGSTRVEIDKTRQVLFLYTGDRLSKILAVSTGTSETPTPNGSFRIFSKAVGWETSHLGRLYNSQYFVGGYAIHGSLSVPSDPASHGCVRITMSAAEWFPGQVPIGTPVHVVGE